MTLREYISFWQETYDKHQSRYSPQLGRYTAL